MHWEHKVEHIPLATKGFFEPRIDEKVLANALNKATYGGWELVNINVPQRIFLSLTNAKEAVAVFKRAK